MTADRLPFMPLQSLDQETRAKVEAFTALRGAPPFGPFVPLMHSPELMLRIGAVGDYCRHHNALGHRLTELIVLLVARRRGQDMEWHIHAPIAAKAGISAATIAAIADGRRPADLSADDTLILDAFDEIDRHERLSDATYAAVTARFGERGAVDLAATIGYYHQLATIMNVARTQVPGMTKLARFPD